MSSIPSGDTEESRLRLFGNYLIKRGTPVLTACSAWWARLSSEALLMGVINDGKRIIFRTQDPGHQFGSTDKFGGHDGKGRYAQLLCFHRIMQTAR